MLFLLEEPSVEMSYAKLVRCFCVKLSMCIITLLLIYPMLTSSYVLVLKLASLIFLFIIVCGSGVLPCVKLFLTWIDHSI